MTTKSICHVCWRIFAPNKH